jgi:alpha-L-fucosidase
MGGKIYKAYPLANKKEMLQVTVNGNNPKIDITTVPRDSFATVIVVEVSKDFQAYNAPEIKTDFDIFMDTAQFAISTDIANAVIHYTTDGSMPTESSSVSEDVNNISSPASFTLKAACFLNGKAVSEVTEKYFSKETPIPGIKNKRITPGLLYKYYEGQWRKLPDFNSLKVAEKGRCIEPDIIVRKQENNYGLIFTGYLLVPETNVYQFQLTSDDGSLLRIGGKTLLNDGLHAMETKKLDVALEQGMHPVEIQFFQAGGGDGLIVSWKIGEMPATKIPAENWGQ